MTESMDNGADEQAYPNLFVEKGIEPDTLIVAFAGRAGKLMLSGFEFFQITGSLPYSRILCKDPEQVWYFAGLDAAYPDVDSSVALLRRLIKGLSPQRLVCVGTSMGAYAALLYGFLLGADRVHAFGTQTCLLQDYVRNERKPVHPELVDLMSYQPLWDKAGVKQDYLDLAPLLATDPRVHRYQIHYCSEFPLDLHAVQRLRGIPSVQLNAYPCDTHLVVKRMKSSGLLLNLLQASSD